MGNMQENTADVTSRIHVAKEGTPLMYYTGKLEKHLKKRGKL